MSPIDWAVVCFVGLLLIAVLNDDDDNLRPA